MFKTEQAKKVFFKGSRLLRYNKAFMLQLGIISAAAIGVADTAFAQTANVATNQISVLSTPMQNFREFMSSDVANFASVAGVGIGAASWAMSDNNMIYGKPKFIRNKYPMTKLIANIPLGTPRTRTCSESAL